MIYFKKRISKCYINNHYNYQSKIQNPKILYLLKLDKNCLKIQNDTFICIAYLISVTQMLCVGTFCLNEKDIRSVNFK